MVINTPAEQTPHHTTAFEPVMKQSSSKESLKNFQLLHNVLFNEMIDKQIMMTTKTKPSRNVNQTDV